jgi:hypothetical protein
MSVANDRNGTPLACRRASASADAATPSRPRGTGHGVDSSKGASAYARKRVARAGWPCLSTLAARPDRAVLFAYGDIEPEHEDYLDRIAVVRDLFKSLPEIPKTRAGNPVHPMKGPGMSDYQLPQHGLLTAPKAVIMTGEK